MGTEDHGGDMRVSRVAEIIGVDVSALVNPDGEGLPTVTVVVCVAAGVGLPHEHIVVSLSPEVIDAIEEGRSALPDVAMGRRP